MSDCRPLLIAWTAGAAACAVWPHWNPITQHDSGLVGEWVGQPAWSGGDTVVWRFDSAGTADRIRWRQRNGGSEVSEDREALGHWRVYNDSTQPSHRFVCFDYGRARARLPCWYFTIAPVDSASSSRRALKLLGRVGGPARAPEVYRELQPDR